MNCDMCDKNEVLTTVLIEGAKLRVCVSCSKYGTVIKDPIKQVKEVKITKKLPEFNRLLIKDFHILLKQSRENKGLKQKEVANKLAIKESLLHNLESGHQKPSERLTSKLERFYNIKLMKKIKEETSVSTTTTSGKLTIGDMIKK